MHHYRLSCEQVGALMAFYIENKLSDKLSYFVEEHLAACPSCREKYQTMKNIINKYSSLKNNIPPKPANESINQHITKQYEEFKLNLSAYIDNELDDDENIKIKKITISNPLARQDLEDIYNFKKLLHTSFEKTKNELKEDYSKNVMMKITDPKNNGERFNITKVIMIFCTVLSSIVAITIKLLYF